jgi:hypothetical protein
MFATLGLLSLMFCDVATCALKHFLPTFRQKVLPESIGQKNEVGGSMFLRNVDRCIPDYMASHPRI